MKKYILLLGVVLTLGFYSCSEDWMSDVVPTDKLDAAEAFNTIKDGRNAVNGVFSLMQDEDYYGADIVVYGDLKGIDVQSKSIGKRDDQMYLFRETTEASPSGLWTRPYQCLVSVNNAIVNMDKLEAANEEEEAQKNEIEANFYALRGLIHFDLLKVFARIPTAIEGDVGSELGIVLADHVIGKDEKPMRANLEDSYKFVIADLQKAIALMPANANTEGWFTINAVKALLAKVYLYNGDNQLAFDLAQEVIGSKAYSLVKYGEYKDSWLNSSNNPEAILTLVNTDEDNASREGVGNLWNKEGYNTMILTESFQQLIYADASDDRLNAIEEDVQKDEDGNVTGTEYLCMKYPEQYAYLLRMIRLSEMYFIAAEATYKVNSANADKAAELLNVVLKERLNKENVLSADDVSVDRILVEKRKEFVGEGSTFFDLIRNKKDIVRTGEGHLAGAPKEVAYDDFRTIQPIPRIELNVNNDIQQNAEYAK